MMTSKKHLETSTEKNKIIIVVGATHVLRSPLNSKDINIRDYISTLGYKVKKKIIK